MIQIAGYETPLSWITDLNNSVEPPTYWIATGVMFLMSIIDFYVFAMHPL